MVHRFYVYLPVLVDGTYALYITTDRLRTQAFDFFPRDKRPGKNAHYSHGTARLEKLIHLLFGFINWVDNVNWPPVP